jgi:beta-carotene ketolase (CrtO type)
MHSVQDRSLVPPGSNGDTLYFYLTSVASQLSGGRDWLTEKHRFAQAILDHFEQYAPGTQDSIIDMLATSPPEFESEFNVYKGSYNHADPILSQMGPTRPVPALRGWRTPVDGLWHTGAGAFPFGWISGWPGRGTAREILRVDKRHRRPAMPPATVEPAPSGPPQSVDVPSASTHAPVA